MKKTTVPTTRNTLAARIRKEPNLWNKMHIAKGVRSVIEWYLADRPSSEDADVFAMVELTQDVDPASDGNLRPRLIDFAAIGMEITDRISRGDSHFFQKLAAILQHPRKPDDCVTYYRILQFYLVHNLYKPGMLMLPADGLALAQHLERSGLNLGRIHDKEVPKRLRDICRSIGAPLNTRKAGRPRKK